MIIQCQSCAAKYFLPEEKVPVNPLKVRCPKCRAVFMLAGKRDRVEVGAGVAAAPPPKVAAALAHDAPAETPAFAPTRPTGLANDDARAPMKAAASAPLEGLTTDMRAAAAAPAAPAPAPEPELVETPADAVSDVSESLAGDPAPAQAVAPAKSAEPKARGGKSADDRAKRLARVLVSDILWYNRERRDAALKDGTLMTSLGEEIKKSWELYKEKVGPEAAHSTNYFKEALNEILADGQQVF